MKRSRPPGRTPNWRRGSNRQHWQVGGRKRIVNPRTIRRRPLYNLFMKYPATEVGRLMGGISSVAAKIVAIKNMVPTRTRGEWAMIYAGRKVPPPKLLPLTEIHRMMMQRIREASGKPLMLDSETYRTQAALIKLGLKSGYDVHAPPADRKALSTLGINKAWTATELPIPAERCNGAVRHIDVIWLRDGKFQAAFEVEGATIIHSGIGRLNDLKALLGPKRLPTFVVVPQRRRLEALNQLDRPAIRKANGRGIGATRLLSFERVRDLLRSQKDQIMRELFRVSEAPLSMQRRRRGRAH